jgi:hypothetical protein
LGTYSALVLAALRFCMPVEVGVFSSTEFLFSLQPVVLLFLHLTLLSTQRTEYQCSEVRCSEFTSCVLRAFDVCDSGVV